MSPERKSSLVASFVSKARSIEQNPKLYERLGVRVYKKYTVPFGDLAHKYFWNRIGMHPANLSNRKLESLRVMKFGTYIYEGVHSTVDAYLTKEIIDAINRGDLENAAGKIFANVISNIYPILVQHYNRGRLSRAIERKENLDRIASD